MKTNYEILELNPGNHIKILTVSPASDLLLEKPPKKEPLKIIIIPGNPGIVELYQYFAQELTKFTNIPVMCISHTGHFYDERKILKKWPVLKLQQQISDKIQFLNQRIFDTGTSDVVFIGHSIGCHIILHILKELPREKRNRVKKSYLLFPTIERMRITPNGKFFTFFGKYFKWVMYFGLFLISKIIPRFLRQKGLYWFYMRRLQKNPHLAFCRNFEETVLSFSDVFSALMNMLIMGYDEMMEVFKLDENLLRIGGARLVLYYGRKDAWCPVSFYEDLKSKVDEWREIEEKPTLILDDFNLEHGFVAHKRQCDIIIKELIVEGIKRIEMLGKL